MIALRREIEKAAQTRTEKAQDVSAVAQQFFREGSISTEDLRGVLESVQEGYASLAQERLERALSVYLLAQQEQEETIG